MKKGIYNLQLKRLDNGAIHARYTEDGTWLEAAWPSWEQAIDWLTQKVVGPPTADPTGRDDTYNINGSLAGVGAIIHEVLERNSSFCLDNEPERTNLALQLLDTLVKNSKERKSIEMEHEE